MELEQDTEAAPTPENVVRICGGFWALKTLLSAVELGLFTELAQAGALELHELCRRLGLHRRGARDFLDALVALGLLRRGVRGYANTPESARFLDRRRRTYIGSVLLMAGERLYPSWGRLTQALQTGLPQREAASSGDHFNGLYSEPKKLRLFLQAMTFSLRASAVLAAKFPWIRYHRVVDLGTAQGGVLVELALVHPHLTGCGFDLPVEQPLLLAKVHAALPAGGAVIVYDSLIGDGRCRNAFALLMSLNMLLQTTGGSEYTARECAGWLKQAGFQMLRAEPLAGTDTMIVAVKQ